MLNNVFQMFIPPILLKMFRWIYNVPMRRLVARRLDGEEKLHLACGNRILDGWANVDFKGGLRVIGWDLTCGLPVRSKTISLIFCEHFIEHISLQQAETFLSECYRCLRVGGVLRLSTPSLEKVVEEYELGRTSEWHDVGFRPATPCQMVNEAFRLWGHQFVYDEKELKELLNKVGFGEIRLKPWHESGVPGLERLESRPFHGEIIFEAVK